ncbi:MAG: hypothetical protein KDA61_12525, partial [Planctomycetales bacterium]|nr:hypothetical protein [Planctomycetales bacterium]
DVQQGGRVHLVNEGYWGVPVRAGEKYAFSAFVKAGDGFVGKSLAISLRDKSLKKIYAEASLEAARDGWEKLACTLAPNADDYDGRLVITAKDDGAYWIDMASLFPATYKNQANGLRTDLVEMLAALKPSFFRFPGGCFVEGQTLEDAFRFKETIGPVESRKGRRNFWNYHNTDGLGYFEYLRLSEDLGADPIFCINPGGNNGATERIPLDELGPWLETAVDAIEFAIGPADSEWGAKRAEMGHPEPFAFDVFYMQVGNETEFGNEDYLARFKKYRDHVKKAYPGDNVRIIGDSWGLAMQQSVETYAIDFHEYMSWTRAIADRDLYDDAPRGAPYVFKGEYATRSGSGIMQGLSEAVYMMGLEENGDEVVLAAYAPLFGNVNQCQWHPNLIYFDNHRVMGTISYYVQQMFSQHRGDHLLPVDVAQDKVVRDESREQMSGSVVFATWSTQAEFDDLRVVVDGETVYENDFSDDADVAEWRSNGIGEWKVADGVLRQSSDDQSAQFWLQDRDWTKYTARFRARKTGGAEGFMGMFNVKNAMDWGWANVGGWSNTQHAFERSQGGAKLVGARSEGSIESGKWYDVEIAVDGSQAVVKLDGKELLRGDLADVLQEPDYDVYASAVTDDEAKEVVVRVVNIGERAKRVTIRVG